MEPKCTPSKGVRERVSINQAWHSWNLTLMILHWLVDYMLLIWHCKPLLQTIRHIIRYIQTCSTQDMFPKLKIPGNKKPEKQRTFVSTKNKQPSRKKAFSLKAMTKEQKSELLSSASGTVAPYPPLRLVRSHQQPHQPAQSPNNMFVTNNIIQIPSGYLMPPSMQNINIPIIGPDGKASSLMCSNDGARVENENDLL